MRRLTTSSIAGTASPLSDGIWGAPGRCRVDRHRQHDGLSRVLPARVGGATSLAARKKGLTGYQFRAPAEWFAELYAGYKSKKLGPKHPANDWLKKL